MSSSSLFVPERAVVLATYFPITAMLESEKIDVVHADAPAELLDIARTQSIGFAVIESDVLEAHKGFLVDVRATDPLLPIILLASHHGISPAAQSEAFKVGLVGYISTAELTPHLLVSSVQSLVDFRSKMQTAGVMDLLDEIFESREDAMRWLRSPHPDLGGRRPLAFLMRGETHVVADLIEGTLDGILS